VHFVGERRPNRLSGSTAAFNLLASFQTAAYFLIDRLIDLFRNGFCFFEPGYVAFALRSESKLRNAVCSFRRASLAKTHAQA
jgi:hypothetical protein